MYKFKSSVIGLIGLLTLIAIITVTMPHVGRGASGTNAPTSQTQNVNVVNTPTVNAQQSGTWNVGINGTPVVGLDAGNNTVKFDAVNNTVKIDPTNPLPVRDVDNPATQPFQAAAFGTFANGDGTCGLRTITTVPAGKRLIIEHVSVLGSMLPGQKMVIASILVTLQNGNTNGFGASHPLTISPQGSNDLGTRDLFLASESIRLYADLGTSVFSTAYRDSTSGAGASAEFQISGYFVDVP